MARKRGNGQANGRPEKASVLVGMDPNTRDKFNMFCAITGNTQSQAFEIMLGEAMKGETFKEGLRFIARVEPYRELALKHGR